MVAAREHALDDERREHRQRQRERAQRDRRHDDACEQRGLRGELAEIAPHLAAAGGRGDEALRRLELERDAREVLAEPLDRDRAAAERRIDDVDGAATHALEHDEVVEVPVQDRTGRQVRQVLDLEPHAAAAQPELFRAAEDAERVRTAVRAGDRARLVERHRSPVIPAHHREARGTAVGGLGLLDELQPAATTTSEALERRRDIRRELVRHRNLRRPGTSANTIGSEATRTSAVPRMPS
jgi:hypothetical protein